MFRYYCEKCCLLYKEKQICLNCGLLAKKELEIHIHSHKQSS